MPPGKPSRNSRYHRRSDAGFCRQTLVRPAFGTRSTDVQNNVIIDLGLWIERAFPRPRTMPPLVDHVVGIVLRGSNKEMGLTNTRRVIAVVQHPHSFRDCSVLQRPGEPMRGGELTHSRTVAQEEVTVPLRVLGFRPQPAWTEVGAVLWDGTIAVNLRPEALFRGTLVGHRSYPFGEPRTVSAVPGHLASIIPPGR